MTLLIVYFIFILGYGNDVRKKANARDFYYSSSKWVVRQQRQLATSTMRLVQELLMNSAVVLQEVLQRGQEP